MVLDHEESIATRSNITSLLRASSYRRRATASDPRFAPAKNQNVYFNESCTLRPGPAPGTCPNVELGSRDVGFSK